MHLNHNALMKQARGQKLFQNISLLMRYCNIEIGNFKDAV